MVTWMDGLMVGWTDKLMHGWMYGLVDECTDIQIDGWVDI
jgi:hypothetical protein